MQIQLILTFFHIYQVGLDYLLTNLMFYMRYGENKPRMRIRKLREGSL